ncbi:hypothetical protein [uncultured Holdemanella sp.]|uniref:hypothetical protein n=1 Tax=uncultured Holdemanella sp. TaxID=1763549 RepID=UPI0025D46EFA|nr:hypothetical protein [uncultured Holdemanella sp.]
MNRELSHFVSSPNYMLNCGLGTFLMPLCAMGILWKGKELFELLDATKGSACLLVCVVLCSLASMNLMAAPSISLEGKSLWILQMLSVDPRRIFRAKIIMQLILTGVPLCLCIVCIVVVYHFDLLQLLMLVLFEGSYVLFMTLLGLFLGVKMPILTWTNEIVVIKQVASVVITLFGGFGYITLLLGGYLLLPGWTL